MSVHRSPKSGKLGRDDGGGSSPDLHTPTCEETFISRKRNRPDLDVDIIKSELDSFRKEIMCFFKEFAKSQKTDIMGLKQDLVEIKDEIKTLNSVTENLSQKYDNMQKEVSDIKSENAEFREKLQTLQSEIIHSAKISANSTTATIDATPPISLVTNTPNASHEALFLEIEERHRRLNNIIIVGISELAEKNLMLRQQYDLDEGMKVLETILEQCPKPVKTIRLGKYSHDNNRPIKAFFKSPDTVRAILRNKSKLTDERVRIYADQTPSQKTYLQNLKDELLRRKNDGESDLMIKYVKGVPKIMIMPPKNSNQ